MSTTNIARGFMLHVLDAFGFDGIYTPWDAVYIRPDCINDSELVLHELAHRAQRNRDGWWYFWPTICLDFVFMGYANSPYEVEARDASKDLTHPLWRYVNDFEFA